MRKKIFNVKYILLICLTVSVFYLIYLVTNESVARSITSYTDVGCHYVDPDYPTPELSHSFRPPNGTIFFHETSCPSVGDVVLEAREACSVESIARLHPERDIYLLFSSPLVWREPNKLDRVIEILLYYDNVRVARVNLERYSMFTPLEDWIKSGILINSEYRLSHTSDVLRYLTLYKYGGVYVDLDVIGARSLDMLGDDWVGRESDNSASSGVIAVSSSVTGRVYAAEIISDIKENFRGDLWGHNGPGVITRVLKKICKTRKVTHMTPERCQGFKVYGPQYFYPIDYKHWYNYFNHSFVDHVKNMTKPYAFHIWNKFSHSTKVTPDVEVPYSYLARRYCPKIYEYTKGYF